jgi:arginine/lysine/ornithine decarboxylase
MTRNTPDQTRAPFFDALLAYRDAAIVPFSTPGHKLGNGAPAEVRDAFGKAVLALDVPHGGGADDTHRTRGVLREAERIAAAAWHADDCLFLVNGSSTGNIAALLATCQPGDTVIVARNMHRSLLSGLILSGARPVYVYPAVDSAQNLSLDVPAADVAAALRAHPETKAVALVSPAYTGVSSDLPAIARLCAGSNVPLFVDEAWGPHFPFHPDLPPSAMQAGASGGVASIHKMLAGLTQASLLTMRGPLLTRAGLEPYVSMIETTSPSALIYASIDAARRQMALGGRNLLDRTINLAWEARAAISRLPGLRVIDDSILSGRGGAGFDPTRIMIDTLGAGMTGFQAEAFLRDRCRVGVEMSDLTGVIVHITIGDDGDSVRHLTRGFEQLARDAMTGRAGASASNRATGVVLFSARPEMTPRDAATGRSRAIPLRDAAGEIAAEMITPYPPGIPVVAPGDRLSVEVIDYLLTVRAAGMYISGPSDPSLATVRVVDPSRPARRGSIA